MKTWNLALVMLLAATGCKYSNLFEGTYVGADGKTVEASVSAYSKNINKYCLHVEMTGGPALSTGIGSSEVFNKNDLLAPKAFNTKESTCNYGTGTYLSGKRTTAVTGKGSEETEENCSIDWCQSVRYETVQYIESIEMKIHDIKTDAVTGTFTGKGQPGEYTNYDKVIARGPCNIYCSVGGPGMGCVRDRFGRVWCGGRGRWGW
jgi:hypothetical protein